jgi:tripartite-type tricarboxylate transporter receptor subunit TctC
LAAFSRASYNRRLHHKNIQKNMSRIRSAILLASALLLPTSFAVAQNKTGAAANLDYPTKPIRFMASFPAGGVGDIVSRIVVRSLSQRLGQSIVVDNKSGAGGVIGAEAIAKSAPDGYTMGIGTSGSLGINVALMPGLPYQPLKDFELAGKINDVPIAIAVNPNLNIHTLKELLALAKTKPGKLTYGSAGNGTAMHLAGQLLNQMAGVNIVHAPYKGSSPAVMDLLAGHIDVAAVDLATIKPFLESGRLKALAVTSSKRTAIAPELPTVAEAGVPGYELTSWMALVMPAGTPATIVNRVNRELVATLNEPAVRQQLLAAKTEPDSGTPAELRALVEADIEKYRKLARQANLVAN